MQPSKTSLAKKYNFPPDIANFVFLQNREISTTNLALYRLKVSENKIFFLENLSTTVFFCFGEVFALP